MSNGLTVARLKDVAQGLIPPMVMPGFKRLLRLTPYARGRLVHGPKTAPGDPAGILETAWRHLAASKITLPAGPALPATPRWEFFLERIRGSICFLSSPAEAIHFAQSKVNFDHREPVINCRHLFDLHAETLKAHFPGFSDIVDRTGDSEFSRPETLLRCGGRVVSNMLFWHLNTLLQSLTHVKKLNFVCEIGAGYGALTRYFLNTPETSLKTYCVVDFPECLFFSEVFLRANFDNLPVHYVTDSAPLDPEIVSRCRVIFCPLRHLSAVSKIPFDLVINTGSMQEMTEEWIDFWMTWLSRQPCRWFYSMNYFGQPLGYMGEGGNTWSPRLGNGWITRVQNYDPALIRQQSSRNFAEIIAEKSSAATSDLTEAALLYKCLRRQAMTNQTLLQAMDIVRTTYQPDMIWDILRRVISEMSTVPKEAWFLAQYLQTHLPDRFSPQDKQQLAMIFQRLEAIRGGGLESGYGV